MVLETMEIWENIEQRTYPQVANLPLTFRTTTLTDRSFFGCLVVYLDTLALATTFTSTIYGYLMVTIGRGFLVVKPQTQQEIMEL